MKNADPIVENKKTIEKLIAEYEILYKKIETLSGQLLDLQRQIFGALAKQQQLRRAKKWKKERNA